MASAHKVIPLMPKATAVWLIRNTALTFKQIADACNLHTAEIEALEDSSLQGDNPILSQQLTQEEIDRCTADESASLMFTDPMQRLPARPKERRYMPRAYRQDRPDAICWLLKYHPEIPDSKIVKLVSSTLKTVQSVREKMSTGAPLNPRNPVLLGLCTEAMLSDTIVAAEKNKPAPPVPSESTMEQSAESTSTSRDL